MSDMDPAISQLGKTALYYEYTLVDVKEDHVIEKTLTDLLNDPNVPNENIRKVTYYLVQRFFIKSANEKKENIDLISQIPSAFKKMVDTLPRDQSDKNILIKYYNLYLEHTIATQEDLAKLFQGYARVFKGFMNNLKNKEIKSGINSVHDKEVVIDGIYQDIDSMDQTIDVLKASSKKRARAKIDNWITRIFENHVIEGALDIVTALEEYCLEETDLSRQRSAFLKKYSKINLNKISKSIMEDKTSRTVQDALPIITENIFINIDNLTKEHDDYKKFLSEIFEPIDKNFVTFFFNQFFAISAFQKNTEKDIYLIEKTFRDLGILEKFKKYFIADLREKISEGADKAYCIENYFDKSIQSIEGPHKNTYAYMTLKYILAESLDQMKTSEEGSKFPQYQRALRDFIRPKYPKFLDQLIFIYLKQSKELERKVGNTKKSFSNIYENDKELFSKVFQSYGLIEDYKRTILPCITGFEQSNQILKKQV